MSMTISVIVPTFYRVDALSQCIQGLTHQKRQADEIIVVLREEDKVTFQYLSELNLPNMYMSFIDKPGQVAALNAGVKTARGSILAITDDDTIPHPDWLEKIEQHFEQNPLVGGVGGRDIVHHRGIPVEASQATVGKIMPFGRIVGNHHIGLGNARIVHILKGANMSFRLAALDGIEFDVNLKGAGAQVHNDMEFSLAIMNKGWYLIYDPMVCVDHYPAERFDEDQRNSFNPTASFNASHNEMYTLLKHSNWGKRIICLLWVFLIGTKSSPGVVQCLRLLPSQRMMAVKKMLLAYKGRWGGWITWRGSLD